MVKTNSNSSNNHPTTTAAKEVANQMKKILSKRKHSIRKSQKEAATLKDVYNGIYNLANKMTTVAERMNEIIEYESYDSKIDQFFSFRPPFFGQYTDPLLATDWIYILDSIFDLIGCFSDEQKVSLAVLRLMDDALCWWRMEERGLVADGIAVTWLKFKTLFYERYFPKSLQFENFIELTNIVQGDRTVAEYDAEFMKLCSLAQNQKYVVEDVWKAAFFERGLRREIRRQLDFLDDMSYVEVRNEALRLERLEQRLNARRDQGD